MEFLQALEAIRSPLGDLFFGAVTHLGDETLFMIVALIVFWCMDKHRGYYLLFVGFSGVVTVQFLKMLFRVPRPWVLDPQFTIVESARAAATGYSFPSGHTLCGTALYGGMARSSTRAWERAAGIVLALTVAFSRLYLGVHTPWDVGASLLLGCACVFLLYPIIEKTRRDPRFMYLAIGIAMTLALANLLFVELYRFPADTDPVNLQNATEVAWKLTGVIGGMCLLYPIDHAWLHFETRAVWWAQILKLCGGALLVVLVRAGLKEPLNLLCGTNVGSMLRYFLMVTTAGVLWPMTFGWFARLGRKKETRA